MLLEIPRHNQTKDIVPFETSLPDGREVSVKPMTESQLTETYELIQQAAQSGNGFGIDEYGSETEFRDDIKGAKCYAVVTDNSQEMVAAVIIAISRYYRGANVADPFILVNPTQRGKGIGEFCLRLSMSIAQCLGFIGMYVDTFSNNKAMIKIIENIGCFQKVGCLPMGGRMNNGTFVGTVIYYMDIGQV